jgi:hypothetical protein
MTTATKQRIEKPRIESITIEHIYDDNPDSSYLGKYSDQWQVGAIKRYNAGWNEYKYFIPAISYKEHWKDLHKMGYSKGNCDYLARSYNYQDYRRMERLNNGDWCYIGIRAKAEVSYPIFGNSHRLEHFTSGGLYGIESDSDNSYIKEIEQEQLDDLKEHLKTFNVSIRNFNKIEIEHTERY